MSNYSTGMIEKILFLIFATLCLSLTTEKTTIETCHTNNSNDCHFFNWRPWSSCMGKCGYQNQTRERLFCCNSNVQPHTVENCLLHCNLSRHYPTNENRICRMCQNGGTLHSVSILCGCSPNYKGDCCQDAVTCSDNPCKHGTCSDQPPNFVCTCDPGYKGINCDTRKTCSEGIICKNGGTCQNRSNGFQCLCQRKYSGEFCEKEYGLLTVVSLTGVLAMGCVCLKCCQSCGVIKDDDDDKDEKRAKNGSRRFQRNTTIPLDTKNPHSKRNGLDF